MVYFKNAICYKIKPSIHTFVLSSAHCNWHKIIYSAIAAAFIIAAKGKPTSDRRL